MSDVIPVVLTGAILAATYFLYWRSKNKEIIQTTESKTFRASLSKIFHDSPHIQLWIQKQTHFPWMTMSLSLLLFFAFLLQQRIVPLLTLEQRDFYFLTSGSINFVSLTLAQVTHINLFHLIINAFALLIMGPSVELWLGARRFLLIYLLGGYLSLLTTTLYFVPENIRLLGASANITAIAGCYAVFRVSAWLPVYNRIFHGRLPRKEIGAELISNFILVFAFDIIGIFMKLPGIAFQAHLTGAMIGVTATFIIRRYQAHFLYSFENLK